MKKNRLKEKLNSGGVAVGVFVWEPALQLIEILGLLGFDYIYIDIDYTHLFKCEQDPTILEQAENWYICIGRTQPARTWHDERATTLLYISLHPPKKIIIRLNESNSYKCRITI